MYIIFIYPLNIYQIYLIYKYISISDYMSECTPICIKIYHYTSIYLYIQLYLFLWLCFNTHGEKRNWRLKVGKWKSSSRAHSGGQWALLPAQGCLTLKDPLHCSMFSTWQPWESPEMYGLRLKWGCKPEPVDIAAIPPLLRVSISNPTLPPQPPVLLPPSLASCIVHWSCSLTPAVPPIHQPPSHPIRFPLSFP